MDDVVVQVVPLHNSSREEIVSKLFGSEWVNYEASVIVPYVCLFVCWLLNVPATGVCISGTDLLRQFYVLPH